MGAVFISSSAVQRIIIKAMFYMIIIVSVIGLVTPGPGMPPYAFGSLSTHLPTPLTLTD